MNGPGKKLLFRMQKSCSISRDVQVRLLCPRFLSVVLADKTQEVSAFKNSLTGGQIQLWFCPPCAMEVVRAMNADPLHKVVERENTVASKLPRSSLEQGTQMPREQQEQKELQQEEKQQEHEQLVSKRICNGNHSSPRVDDEVEDDAAVTPSVIVAKKKAAAETFVTPSAAKPVILAKILHDTDDGFEADNSIEVDKAVSLNSEQEIADVDSSAQLGGADAQEARRAQYLANRKMNMEIIQARERKLGTIDEVQALGS